jgi:hypothetical protein
LNECTNRNETAFGNRNVENQRKAKRGRPVILGGGGLLDGSLFFKTHSTLTRYFV